MRHHLCQQSASNAVIDRVQPSRLNAHQDRAFGDCRDGQVGDLWLLTGSRDKQCFD
jgi:hypothetical protein